MFYPNLTISGVYDIYIDIPSAAQDGTLDRRGQINIAASLQPWSANTSLFRNQLDQTLPYWESDLVYTGFISASSGDFAPNITITPAAGNSTVLAVQQVRITQAYYPTPAHTLSPGARAGIGVGVSVGVLLLVAILYFTSCCCCCCGFVKSKRGRATTTATPEAMSHYQTVSRDVERNPEPRSLPQNSTADTAEMEAAASSGPNTQTTGTPELVAVSSDRKTWSGGDQPPPYSA